MMKNIFLLLSFLVSLQACSQSSSSANRSSSSNKTSETDGIENSTTAYFASGCFWCVEAIFESIDGVHEVISGYAGGHTINPSYQQVISGKTGHAETVQVYYDAKTVRFEDLIMVFFESHDPTTHNQQGPDIGSQYRSIAFYKTEAEKKAIQAYIQKLKDEKVYKKPITTEVKRFTTFYKAEEVHQDFERRNPNNPYSQKISKPRLLNFQVKHPNMIKKIDDKH